jgi:hypothetical protein
LSESRESAVAITQQKIGQALVWQGKELNVRRVDIEDAQRGQRFCAPQFSPAFSIRCAQAPSSFDYSLWPGIVIPICDVDNANGRSSANRLLENDATSQRFIVRVWRDQH